MRDMIPPGDRSIRNIPIPASHHHISREEIPEHYQPEPPQPRRRARRRPGRFIVWALIIIVICGGAVAGVSMVYAGASVAVVPRTEAVVTASTTLQALISAPVGTLAFARLSATQSATTTVPATGTKKASRTAHGVVTLTSTYTASQRLIANTRLAASDGKIYRLASSIDLPANGSVTAQINAESPGEAYNRSGSITFTLPGFAGDPRFEKFSAKSQGAISGGFVGDEPAVADADLEAAKAELKAQLDTSTQRQLSETIPATSVAIPGTLTMVYGDIVQAASADKKSATLSQSATATGGIMNVRDFASALARKLVSDYKGEAVDFKDQGTLTVSVASSTKAGDEQLFLQVTGDTTLVWQFDPNKLKEAMLGKDKGQFQSIVQSFAPAITSATATVRPFWIKNFPSDPEKITVDIDTGK
jgi:hypothetical protein